jgi:GT2 family glycosyltransferase
MFGSRSHTTENESGNIHCAILIDSHALVLMGTVPEALPDQGAAVFFGGEDSSGEWRSVCWERPGDGLYDFVAVLGVETITQLHAGAIRVTQGDVGAAVELPAIDRVDPDPALLIETIQGEKAPAAKVLKFLHGILETPEFGSMAGLTALRASTLEALSAHSGFIEIIARPDCGGMLVQGWSIDLASGFGDLIVQHKAPERFDGVVAVFDRDDLPDNAKGIVAYIKDAVDAEMLHLHRLYFATDDDYFYLDVMPEPVRFEALEATAHLVQTFPVLKAEEPILRAFKRVCRPVFDGVNTVTDIKEPVRLSVDRAFHVPETGIFLSGWLLDPKKLVGVVALKSTGQFCQEIQEIWYRTARPDVIAGYAEDALFAPFVAQQSARCGFLVFISCDVTISADEQIYLELVLDDESCAFAPITFDTRSADTLATEVLGTIDIDDLAFENLVRSHLGPIIGGAFASRRISQAPATIMPFGNSIDDPVVSVILPSIAGSVDLDINLSRLAGDPDFQDAELILVASQSNLQTKAEQLQEWANFYGLNGQLIVIAEEIDYFDALEIGMQHAASSLLAFLADSVLPDTYGWLGRLRQELDSNVYASAISPTLLYEDLSIRYAGLPVEDEASLEPNGLCQLTGYPLHWLTDRQLCAVHGISEQCVLIRRDAFEQIHGFSREFTGSDVKGIDFSLRLRQAGMTLLWTPSVTLFCLDSGVALEEEPYWRRPAQRIDSWRLIEKWQPPTRLPKTPLEVVE